MDRGPPYSSKAAAVHCKAHSRCTAEHGRRALPSAHLSGTSLQQQSLSMRPYIIVTCGRRSAQQQHSKDGDLVWEWLANFAI